MNAVSEYERWKGKEQVTEFADLFYPATEIFSRLGLVYTFIYFLYQLMNMGLLYAENAEHL